VSDEITLDDFAYRQPCFWN